MTTTAPTGMTMHEEAVKMLEAYEKAMERIRGMESAMSSRNQKASELKFRGVPISQFSRDSLEIMLAYRSMRESDWLNAGSGEVGDA